MHFPPEMPFSFPQAEVTYYQADEREPWSYAWVGFDGKAVPEILARTVFSDTFVFRNEAPESVTLLTDQMKKLCETFFQSPEDQLSAAGNLLLLFSFTKKKAPETSQETHPDLSSESQKNIWKTIMLIPSGFPTWPAIPALTGPISTGSSWKKKKLSPKQYLLRHRLPHGR